MINRLGCSENEAMPMRGLGCSAYVAQVEDRGILNFWESGGCVHAYEGRQRDVLSIRNISSRSWDARRRIVHSNVRSENIHPWRESEQCRHNRCS